MASKLTCLVTEHEGNVQQWNWQPPSSSQIQAVDEALMFISCCEVPSHFVVRVLGTYEECQAALDDMHKVGWEEWISHRKHWCVVCHKTVCPIENCSKHPNDCQLNDGCWVCSRECWDTYANEQE